MSGIVIEKVRKSFDTKDGVVEALKDVNLNIDSGDIYGIIGMSGAGKSTLVRCMNFLEVPTEGQVLIDGKALGDLTEKELRKQREEIGMIFQHFNLMSTKTVAQNVELPLKMAGVPRDERRRRVDEMLELVGLSALRDSWPSRLSGGQKQRTGIARALVTQPEILLCDEATSALDTRTEQEIQSALDVVSRNRTTLVIAHRLSTVINADEIIVTSSSNFCLHACEVDGKPAGGKDPATLKAIQSEVLREYYAYTGKTTVVD